MGGTTWAWNDQRQQYYYHQFFKEQPDLNFRNPLVRKELKVCAELTIIILSTIKRNLNIFDVRKF